MVKTSAAASLPPPSAAPQTAAAYVRVSTDDQLEFSPDSQIERIREYAKKNNLLLAEACIYRERDGVSGKIAARRTEFQRMIADAKQSRFDVILVWKFSRFARNQEESIVYKSLLRREYNINVISVSEPLIDGVFGSLIERIIEWMDEYYSIRLGDEVRRGMTEKAGRGGVVTPPSFGYTMRDGVYSPDAKEAPIVRSIFSDFIAGIPAWTIARNLNAMGITTKRKNNWDKRGVDYVLNNPVYIGKIRWNPHTGSPREPTETDDTILADGQHEPLIPMDLWAAAQERRAVLSKTHSRYAKTQRGSPYILQGLVRCSSCGRTLARCMPSGQNHGMQCTGYSRGVCNASHYINMAQLVDMTITGIGVALKNSQFDLIKKSVSMPPPECDMLEMRIRREEQKLMRVKEAYAAGIDTLEEYRTNKGLIQAEIKRLKDSMPEEIPVQAMKELFREKHLEVVKTLTDPSVSEGNKNLLLRSFVDHIAFNRSATKIDIFFYI